MGDKGPKKFGHLSRMDRRCMYQTNMLLRLSWMDHSSEQDLWRNVNLCHPIEECIHLKM